MTDQERQLADIVEPSDTDVLCGRGGAALRHPGNQTYRRLVNLNKGLYITCLKTEKLKISRSIVAAIREQKGRFLEKDNKKGTWYDIGDKKAVEKTSQALREGQPKLRQKIVEMGGTPAGLMESQLAAGLYNNDQIGLLDSTSAAALLPPQQYPPQSNVAAAAAAAARQQEIRVMQPPSPLQHDLHAEMLQRLSLHDMSDDSHSSAYRQQRLRPSLTTRASAAQELGMPSQLSLLSDFSAFGSIPNESLLTMDSGSYHRAMALASNHGRFPTEAAAPSVAATPAQYSEETTAYHRGAAMPHSDMTGGSNHRKLEDMDRRRAFARMKYNRPPSVRMQKAGSASQKSLTDGMPDIHMVESNLSLFSNMSNVTDSKPAASAGDKPTADTTAKDKGSLPDVMGSGSRHSIMSGLSRISDSSVDHSIFSDLSRKIGNVSTRSIAMSEISVIDLQEQENEDESTSNTSGFEYSEGDRKPQPMMEYDL